MARPAWIDGPGSEELRARSCGGQCSKDTPKLEDAELDKQLAALPAWQLAPDRASISRSFTARNFVCAIDFFDKVKGVAEEEGHHPDLHLTDFRQVQVVISTHAVGGLTKFDLILAAKLDTIDVEYSPKWLKQQDEARGASQG